MERLVTWLWQGMVLAVGVWGLLRLWRPNASTRFAVWWATLGAIVLLLLKVAAPVSDAALPLVVVTLPPVPSPLIAVAIGAWLGLSLIELVHVGVSVSHLRRIKRACRPFPASRERRLRRWLSVRADGRLTRLCLSDHVRSASALGLDGQAIIAINPSLLADVDDEELDHIILHEYAHLRRHDDWLHVLQLAVQALLTLHPAVAAIGRALRLEREAACDDWVVERTQQPTRYAQCLTKVAAFELSAPNALIAAMGIVGRRGDLTRRVERLLAPRRSVHTTRISAMSLASVATMLVAIVVGLSQLPPLIATSAGDGAIVAESGPDAEPAPHAPRALAPVVADTLTRAAAIVVASEADETPRAAAIAAGSRVVPQLQPRPLHPTLQLASMAMANTNGLPDVFDHLPVLGAQPTASSAALVTAASPIAPRGFESSSVAPIAHAADEEIDGMPDADGVTTAVGVASKRVWQRAADAGATVGQRTADLGVNVGQTTGHHAKRAGRAIFSAIKATVVAVH